MLVPWIPEDYAILHNNSIEKLGQILGLRGRQVGQMFGRRKIGKAHLGYLDILKSKSHTRVIFDDDTKLENIKTQIKTCNNREELARACRLAQPTISRVLIANFGTGNVAQVKKALGFKHVSTRDRKNTVTDEHRDGIEKLLRQNKEKKEIFMELGITNIMLSNYLYKKYETSDLSKVRKELDKSRVIG